MHNKSFEFIKILIRYIKAFDIFKNVLKHTNINKIIKINKIWKNIHNHNPTIISNLLLNVAKIYEIIKAIRFVWKYLKSFKKNHWRYIAS